MSWNSNEDGSDGHVVVGYDGRWQADQMLILAAQEAIRRRSPLAVVTVTGAPTDVPGDWDRPHGAWISGTGTGYQQVERRLAGAGDAFAKEFPDLRIDRFVLPYEEITALAVPFRDAKLLILGARDLHRRLAFGARTPSEKLLGATVCPVLAVPQAALSRGGHGGHGLVVAALSGEAEDLGVGEAAAFEAGRRGSALTFLHSYAAGGDDPLPRQVVRAIGELSSVLPSSVATDESVDVLLTREAPVPALCRIARKADLIVTGSRPGALAGGVLGSVSREVMATADCPVMVTRYSDLTLARPATPAGELRVTEPPS